MDTDALLVLAKLNRWCNHHLTTLLSSERIDPKDADMKEVPINKEINMTYDIYTNEDRLRQFFYLHKKLLKPVEAAKPANVNPKTASPKGATAGHFVQFIGDTLDIMDEFPAMKGFYILTDNVPIHPRNVVYLIVSQRGYIPVHLPPYSPELNPIEMFWKVLKDRVKRGKLADAGTLSSRIIEGSKDVSVKYLQSFIQHSINVIPNCLNK